MSTYFPLRLCMWKCCYLYTYTYIIIICTLVVIYVSCTPSKLQVNNFQKVFLIYHFSKELERKFYMTERLFRIICPIFKRQNFSKKGTLSGLSYCKGGLISESIFNLVKSEKKCEIYVPWLFTLDWKVKRQYFAHFFENGTKLKKNFQD